MLNPTQSPPLPSDADKADEIVALLSEHASTQDQTFENQDLARGILGNSPYLTSVARRFPGEAAAYFSQSPDLSFKACLDALQAPHDAQETEADFMAFMRDLKNQVALVVAIADVSGVWQLDKVTDALSQLARACLELALARALRVRMQAGDLAWPDGVTDASPISTDANASCGYFLLGMGKLGGEELNYSSDIDLIALYEPSEIDYRGRKSVSDCFIKVTQDVVRFLDQRTMHGYVFRVDLRLRPDPGATPVALALGAAQNYYYSIAANWERAAMIKAAFAAGDKALAEQYLAEMSSWVWRRNMDFEALKDIAAIKNQINRHYQTEEATFRGYDVKLGVGGIREIEFYVQVNQLLHGGRQPTLRLKSTIGALEELAALDLVESDASATLTEAYDFLRRTEHRIQMIADEQTHCVPDDDANLIRLTRLMGYDTPDALEAELVARSKAVSEHYDALLPGMEDDGAILSEQQLQHALHEAGFSDPDAAFQLMDNWKYGRYRSLKTARARDLLAQCMPDLLKAFAKTRSPDAALTRFDGFLAQLPAGVQLFSLLKANPPLLGLLARILGLAPALAEILAKAPGLWDTVLDSNFFAPAGDKHDLQCDLQLQLSTARDYQDVLDFVRRFAAEQKFRLGVLMLEGIASATEVGQSLSDVCDVILAELIPRVEADFAEKHGRFADGTHGIAVVALGKYGGQELTHTSDIDIVYLYDAPEDGAFSNGKKPLSPTVYYARLAQHVTTAITALTPEGRLFEVDTRLRPSGNQGPLAVTLATFEDYYATSAWTWEFLALTRARLVHAPADSAAKMAAAIKAALMRGPRTATLAAETRDMREKLRQEFGTGNIWEVKHSIGGMVDVEFICQYLILKHAGEHPEIILANLPGALDALSAQGCIGAHDAAELIEAYEFQRRVQALLRLCLPDTPATAHDIPTGLQNVLLAGSDFEDFAGFAGGLEAIQRQCHQLYKKLLPAS